MLWLVTLCLIALPAALIVVSSAVVLYYTDRRETSVLSTTVSIIGLSLVLLYSGLIPIDVFAAERVVHIGHFIRDLYYITSAGLLGIVFVAVPFAYFYTSSAWFDVAEEEQRQLRGNGRHSNMPPTTGERLMTACRHTSLCMCLLLLLILVAVTVHIVLTESKPTT